MTKIANKKGVCIRLSDEARVQLDLLVKREERSMSQIVEALILVESKRGPGIASVSASEQAVIDARAAIMAEMELLKKTVLNTYKATQESLDGKGVLFNSEFAALVLQTLMQNAAAKEPEKWRPVIEQVNTIKAKHGRR